MVAKSEELDRLIQDCARRLARARADIRKLEVELQTLMRARRAVFEDEGQLDLPNLPRAREISPEWKDILNFFLQRAPEAVSIDEVMSFIQQRGFDIKRNAVRSQLHLYVHRRFLERMGDGLYRATDAVKPFCA
ncbi:MAG TPA: hypothetical protein VLW88_06350 [Hyphomicrobium sp.]|nr:hypothetical protein [Hyphomicrobium sp.]